MLNVPGVRGEGNRFSTPVCVSPALLLLVGGGICGKTFVVKSKLLACLGFLSSALAVVAQTSAFTYQGQFSSNGIPATGQFDFRFTLHDALTSGIQIAGPLTNFPVGVTNGFFTTTLDFGSIPFDGNQRWLEIGVRTNGAATNAFNTLAPRQQITATPYAVRAAQYSGTIQTTNITGKINDTNLSANVALLTNNVVFTKTITASNFIGSALGLTNISATNLIGTISDARLSTNVAFINTSNTAFLGSISATNFHGEGGGLTNVPGRKFNSVAINTNIQAFPNFGYLATNDSTPPVVTLPLTANIDVGETIRVSASGAAGWIIAQNTNQTILVANLLKNVGLAWRTNASVQNWKAISISQDGQRMAAVINSGFIHVSTNFGVNWAQSPAPSAAWQGVASSEDGLRLVAVANGAQINTSVNGGTNWTLRATSLAWSCVASSWDGMKLVAGVNGGTLWTSVNGGANWTSRDLSRSWSGCASSGDGVNLVACVNGGQIYTSSNSGTNWTARDTTRSWSCVASSADGGTLVAGVTGGLLYLSYDFGVTWSPVGPTSTLSWSSVACSGDGLRMIASASGAPGALYVSQDAGANWQARNNLPTPSYTGVACSGDGGTMAALAISSQIFISSQTSTTVGAAGQLIGSRLSAVELIHAGNGVFIPISYVGNIRAK